MLGRRTSAIKAGQRGQSLVEIGLMLPIMMLLLMGIIDLGFVLYAHVQVAAASYEGARTGSLFRGDLDKSWPENDADRNVAARAAVVGAMGRLDTSTVLNFRVTTDNATSDVKIAYEPLVPTDPPSPLRTGEEMIVSVQYRQPLFFHFLPGMIGDRWQVSTSTRIRIQ